MQTTQILVRDTAWSEITPSSTGVILSRAAEGMLLSVGSTAPLQNQHAHEISGADAYKGLSIGGLSSTDKVYLKSLKGDQYLVVTY